MKSKSHFATFREIPVGMKIHGFSVKCFFFLFTFFFSCWTRRVISKQVVVNAPRSREKLLVRFTRLGILETLSL